MAGERKLATRGEDPQLVVRLDVGGSTNVVSERFVQRARRCTRLVVQTAASSTQLPGSRVGGRGEHVNLAEAPAHGGSVPGAGPRWRASLLPPLAAVRAHADAVYGPGLEAEARRRTRRT